MREIPPETVRPFVFSDPAGKRWPRLRLVLLIAGVLFFLALVVFVQTLFVTPQMRVPFSLRQLKGQLRALQKENPAGQVTTASLLWQKFGADHAPLPRVDDGDQRHGRVASRWGFTPAEIRGKQGNCPDAVIDEPRRRHLATRSGREPGARPGRTARALHSECAGSLAQCQGLGRGDRLAANRPRLSRRSGLIH